MSSVCLGLRRVVWNVQRNTRAISPGPTVWLPHCVIRTEFELLAVLENLTLKRRTQQHAYLKLSACALLARSSRTMVTSKTDVLKATTSGTRRSRRCRQALNISRPRTSSAYSWSPMRRKKPHYERVELDSQATENTADKLNPLTGSPETVSGSVRDSIISHGSAPTRRARVEKKGKTGTDLVSVRRRARRNPR